MMIKIDVGSLPVESRLTFDIAVQGDAPDRMRINEFLPSNDDPGQKVKLHREQ